MARTPEGWTLAKDKRTGVFTCRFRHAGRRRNLSTGETDRRKASIEAARIYQHETTVGGRLHRSGWPVGGSVEELEHLMGEWLATLDAELSEGSVDACESWAGAHWIPFFQSLSAMDEAGCIAYRNERLRAVSATTVRKELSGLRRFLGWAKLHGFIPYAPNVEGVPKKATGTKHEGGKRAQRRVHVSAPMMERLLAELPEQSHITKDPARAYYRFMWETTLRAGTLDRLESPRHYSPGDELLNITEDIDKNRYARRIPITDAARAALDSVCPSDGLIFGREDRRATLKNAALRAGFSALDAHHLSNHDIRHAALTHMGEHTKNIAGMAYLAGHKHLTTTSKYVHPGAASAARVLSDRNPIGTPDGTPGDDAPKGRK